MRTKEITNSADIIDSRDVIERLRELERDKPEDWQPEAERDDDSEEWDEGDEYEALTALAEEGETLSEWEDGVALIRESYFEDYARQLADDLGLLPDSDSWPCNCIDWEQAAEQLKQDYTTVEFGDETYYARS